MMVYTDYSNNKLMILDYEIGDIVRHKLSGYMGIVGKVYIKLNKALVELQDGSVVKCFATSLTKIDRSEHEEGKKSP